jgi:hypothetical protein
MIMFKKTLLLVAVAMSISACTHRIGDFTVGSTKNIDLKGTLHRVDETERLVGKDMKPTILFIPTGIPNMKEAMDRAIEQRVGAVALSNVTVEQEAWVIPFIYGETSFVVEGNPVYEVKK